MTWLGDNMWVGWLVLVVVLAVAELATLDLFLLLLGIAAIGGAVAAGYTTSLFVQAAVFVFCAIVLIGFVRPFLQGLGSRRRPGIDDIIGRRTYTTAAISKESPGHIVVDGESWQAKAYDSSTGTIPAGTGVVVLTIRGSVAYVTPLPKGLSVEGPSEPSTGRPELPPAGEITA